MITAMKKMRLRDFWDNCTTGRKNKILREVSEKCQNSTETVRTWMLGTRNPKGLNRTALFSYIRDNFDVEIIDEGGAQ